MNWRFFLFGCHLDDVHSTKTCFFFLSVRTSVYNFKVYLFVFFLLQNDFVVWIVIKFFNDARFPIHLLTFIVCAFLFFRKTENWIRDKRTECFCKWYFFYQFFSWIPTPRKTFGKNCCHRKCTVAMKYLVLHVVAVCYSSYRHANKRPQDQLGYE